MKLKTLLIGLGRIGFQLEFDLKRYHPCTHAGTLKTLSDKFELVGVCDRNLEKIIKFMNWWGDTITYDTDYKKLLKKIDQIDFVVVATDLVSHNEILRDVISYEVPKILIEKPIFYKSEDFLNLKMNKSEIYVNFERRYHPYYRKVKEIIERKILGNLLVIEGKVLSSSSKHDPMLEDAIHWIDLLIWYIGKPEIIYSKWEYNSSFIEERSYHLMKQDNIYIFLESGGKRKYFEFYMQLDFEKGRIRIGNEGIKIYRKTISRKYQNFFELRKVNTNIPFENPWIKLYNSIYIGDNYSSIHDAYSGIILYEELKKYRQDSQ